MALITDGKASVIVGVSINILFFVVKFVAFLYSRLNLFFADAIDSVADGFIIFVLLLFLKFDLNAKVTFLSMDLMFACQWSAVLLFRVIILLEQISDLISPEARREPELVIIVSCIVMTLGIVLALVFVDEDDVIKCFIDDDEKAKRKALRALSPQKKRNKSCSISPIFAEALDNLATTSIALIVGCLLYAGVAVNHLYLIDDIGNMAISAVMMYLSLNGLLEFSNKYHGKSQYHTIYDLSLLTENPINDAITSL